MGPTFVTSAYQHPQRPKGMDKLVHIDGTVLGRFLHQVPDAPRRLAMLVGGPGIGKTRTAQELASYAETRGIQVNSAVPR